MAEDRHFLKDQANCSALRFSQRRAGRGRGYSKRDRLHDDAIVRTQGPRRCGWTIRGRLGHAGTCQPESPMVRVGIDFEGGRGGHFDGKPNNNCQPDNLVAAARELGSNSTPHDLYAERHVLWSRALRPALRGLDGGRRHCRIPPAGSLIDYPDSVPVWSPIVMKFLGRHPWIGFATK